MPVPPISSEIVLHILGVAADIAGIISFLLTVTLLIRSEALRKEIDAQKREFQNDQESIQIKLIALRENLWYGQPLSLKLISEIRTLLHSFSMNYSRLRSRRDKRELSETLNMLENEPESINILRLCAKLDYFIARLERKERT